MAVSLLEARRQILLNTPHIESASGSIATFNTDLPATLTDMKIHFHPVQEGTGDPSPDNVRPITGWDGVTVTRCGKNLIKPSASLSGVAVRSAGTMVTTDARYNIYVVQVKPNTNYTMKKTGQGYYPTFGLLNKYPELGDVVDGYESLRYRNTYTFNSGDHIYALFSFGVNDFNTIDIQVEEGSTATDYEPYTGISISISFPQTIYGGYVDLVKGEVVEEYGSIDLSTAGFAQYNKSNHCWSGAITNMVLGNQLVQGTLYCESYKESGRKSILSDGTDLGIWGYNASQRRVIIRNDAYIDEDGRYDITAFRESLEGVMLYYPLATPATYLLTPQTIKALKGINNLWSDANGDVEVHFWVH